MTGIKRFLAAVALPLMLAGGATALGASSAAPPERFVGEARVGSQPPLPIHLELFRSGDAVTGTVSIPGGRFDLVDARGDRTIVGRYRGPGGAGALVLRMNGDALTGEFDLSGQTGAITARRTSQDAETFFRPPAHRLELTASQWSEDLERLVAILKREHGAPFHRLSSERFASEVERVRAAIPDLDGIAVALEFRRLAAMIGDGHTSVELPAGRPRLPLEFYAFEDGLRVVRASPAHADLIGAKLVAVDGVAAAAVVERFRAYVAQGETEWFHRANMADLLGDPDVLGAAGLGAGSSIAFAFEDDGEWRQVELTPLPAGERASLGGEPLWRRNAAQAFWSERLADGTVYVNWRSYDGLADESARLLRSLDADHPSRLVVDLRDNDGGDYTVGRAFIEAVRHRPWLNRRGVLYVLIGRQTFSAAMTNAVDFGETTEALLVGEPAGAAPNNWQEVRRFHLPNSGLRVGVSTRHYAFLPDKSVLMPDHRIAPAVEDWGRDRDTALRFVLEQPVP